MTTHDSLESIGARVYGADTTADTNERGAHVYGHSSAIDALGARVYGLGDRGAVSHEQPEPVETHTVAEAPRDTDLDRIGARIEARRSGYSSVTAVNSYGNTDTPGLAGFDY